MSGRTTGGPHFRIPWKGSGESCTAGSGRKVIGGPKPNHAADPGGSETRREYPGVSRSIRGANAPGGVALPQRRRANAWGEVYLPARVKALEYAETPSGVWSPPPSPGTRGDGRRMPTSRGRPFRAQAYPPVRRRGVIHPGAERAPSGRTAGVRPMRQFVQGLPDPAAIGRGGDMDSSPDGELEFAVPAPHPPNRALVPPGGQRRDLLHPWSKEADLRCCFPGNGAVSPASGSGGSPRTRSGLSRARWEVIVCRGTPSCTEGTTPWGQQPGQWQDPVADKNRPRPA